MAELTEKELLKQLDSFTPVLATMGLSQTDPDDVSNDLSIMEHEIFEMGYGPQEGDDKLAYVKFEQIPEKLGAASKKLGRSAFGSTLIVRVGTKTTHGRGCESVQVITEENQDYWILRFPKQWKLHKEELASPTGSQLTLDAFEGARFIDSLLRKNLEGARITNVKKLSALTDADVKKLAIAGLTTQLRDKAKNYVKLIDEIGASN